MMSAQGPHYEIPHINYVSFILKDMLSLSRSNFKAFLLDQTRVARISYLIFWELRGHIESTYGLLLLVFNSSEKIGII